MSDWAHFYSVVGVQLIVFLLLAYQKRSVGRISVGMFFKCVVLGALFGIGFDVLFGQQLGIFGYSLGFDPGFLAINGVLSYGLWFATVQLLRSEELLSFYIYSTAVALIYEVTNYFAPVWSWTFGDSGLFQEFVVTFFAYAGLALLVAAVSSLVLRTKFRALGRI
jgi:hypothetical protein